MSLDTLPLFGDAIDPADESVVVPRAPAVLLSDGRAFAELERLQAPTKATAATSATGITDFSERNVMVSIGVRLGANLYDTGLPSAKDRQLFPKCVVPRRPESCDHSRPYHSFSVLIPGPA